MEITYSFFFSVIEFCDSKEALIYFSYVTHCCWLSLPQSTPPKEHAETEVPKASATKFQLC